MNSFGSSAPWTPSKAALRRSSRAWVWPSSPARHKFVLVMAAATTTDSEGLRERFGEDE